VSRRTHTHHKTTAWSSSLFEQHLLVHNHGAIRHLLLLLCWSGVGGSWNGSNNLSALIYRRAHAFGWLLWQTRGAATVSLPDQILHTINKMRVLGEQRGSGHPLLWKALYYHQPETTFGIIFMEINTLSQSRGAVWGDCNFLCVCELGCEVQFWDEMWRFLNGIVRDDGMIPFWFGELCCASVAIFLADKELTIFIFICRIRWQHCWKHSEQEFK
jgi:hypothetical protein